jgi:hypothetical protein
MMMSRQLLSATAVGAMLLAGCNQTQQARWSGDESAELAVIRQWQAEANLLPPEERGRYLADRMAGLLPDAKLNACPPASPSPVR